MAKEKYIRIDGSDEYGREAWLMLNKDKTTGKVCVFSSEEGGAIMYSSQQIKQLIEALKKCAKE